MSEIKSKSGILTPRRRTELFLSLMTNGLMHLNEKGKGEGGKESEN